VNKYILALVFGIAALAFGAATLYAWSSLRIFQKDSVRATARLVDLTARAQENAPVPIVEIADQDGKLSRHKARAANVRVLSPLLGQEVEVQYTKKKVFGLDVWNIQIITGQQSVDSSGGYGLFTVVLCVLAIGFLIAALRLLFSS
jgi:hypothetical protein